MKALILNTDLIEAVGDDSLVGVDIPTNLNALDIGQLRFDGTAIVDASTITDWLIDDDGKKRLPAMHVAKTWQTIACNFNDVLILDIDVWRVETDADHLAAAKANAIVGIVSRANSFTASILSKYPEAERTAWPQKQAEAQIIMAADAASTSITTAVNKTVLLKAMKTAQGLTNAQVVTLAALIMTKAGEFATIAAMVEVMRSDAETAISAASDLTALDAVKITLTQQTETLAAQYGLV